MSLVINKNFDGIEIDDGLENFEKCEICFEEFDDNELMNKPYSLYPCGNY